MTEDVRLSNKIRTHRRMEEEEEDKQCERKERDEEGSREGFNVVVPVSARATGVQVIVEEGSGDFIVSGFFSRISICYQKIWALRAHPSSSCGGLGALRALLGAFGPQ